MDAGCGHAGMTIDWLAMIDFLLRIDIMGDPMDIRRDHAGMTSAQL
jgi:hypothetical protein